MRHSREIRQAFESLAGHPGYNGWGKAIISPAGRIQGERLQAVFKLLMDVGESRLNGRVELTAAGAPVFPNHRKYQSGEGDADVHDVRGFQGNAASDQRWMLPLKGFGLAADQVLQVLRVWNASVADIDGNSHGSRRDGRKNDYSSAKRLAP
ncbi:hypothetical protein [Nevskia soli]|uniref:hypothetical protein n=1 Tax=Nevskia soli TaxID=418856 RepID=UPI001FE0B330|nr:hypothetical protein [Nevskia soli]